jgi:hypothetical protein
MINENERGTANRFGGPSPGRKNQPTGPIAKQSPLTPSTSFPPTKRFNGKPAVETLGGINVPDQIYFAGSFGQRNVARKVFDAELNRAKQTLTLIVRIKFEFVDRFYMDWKDGKPVWGKLLQSWEDKPERKEKFISAFTKLIKDRWSNKHKLHPATACNEPVKVYNTAIRIDPVSTGEHKIAKIHFDNATEISGGSFSPVVSRASANLHEMMLSESDVKIQAEVPSMLQGKRIHTKNYSVAAHEFGHAIGVHHINEKATNADSSRDPYGETLEQRNDTMGHGENIGLEDMWPFIVAIYYFTGCRWEAK